MRLSIGLGARSAGGSRLRRLLVLLVIVGIPSLLYTYVYPPVAERVEAMQRQLAQEKAQLETLRREADAARGAAKRLPAARARLDDLAREFPARVDQPRLLEYLENAASAEGLSITKIQYGEAEAADAYQQIPVELTVSGPFAAQTNFTLALQGMPWLFRFNGVKMKAQSDGSSPAKAGSSPVGTQPATPADEPVPGEVEAVYELALYIDVPAPTPPSEPESGSGQGNQTGGQGTADGQAAGVEE